MELGRRLPQAGATVRQVARFSPWDQRNATLINCVGTAARAERFFCFFYTSKRNAFHFLRTARSVRIRRKSFYGTLDENEKFDRRSPSFSTVPRLIALSDSSPAVIRPERWKSHFPPATSPVSSTLVRVKTNGEIIKAEQTARGQIPLKCVFFQRNWIRASGRRRRGVRGGGGGEFHR